MDYSENTPHVKEIEMKKSLFMVLLPTAIKIAVYAGMRHAIRKELGRQVIEEAEEITLKASEK